LLEPSTIAIDRRVELSERRESNGRAGVERGERSELTLDDRSLAGELR
jgi:hypothetical protein